LPYARAALDAAARRGIDAVTTHSGAGHDAGHLAAAAIPAALLFVPLSGGQSHTPQEAADEADVLAAGRVLVDVLGDN
jgi:N-carbamoyl-L-amino-acid hydrolase